MRGENDFRALLDGIVYRRQRARNARVVLNRAVFDRHVEIHANENPFSFYIYVFDSFLVHKIIVLNDESGTRLRFFDFPDNRDFFDRDISDPFVFVAQIQNSAFYVNYFAAERGVRAAGNVNFFSQQLIQ